MRKKVSKEKQKKISKEIGVLMRKYKATGKIKTSRATYKPKNKKNAMKIAAAIAYGENRK